MLLGPFVIRIEATTASSSKTYIGFPQPLRHLHTSKLLKGLTHPTTYRTQFDGRTMQVFPYRNNADTFCQTYSNAYGKFIIKSKLVQPVVACVGRTISSTLHAANQFHRRHCSNNRSVPSFSGQMIAKCNIRKFRVRTHTTSICSEEEQL